MARFVAYVTAVQWLGTNVTEVRQIINASGGSIVGVTINPVDQALSLHYSVEAVAANPTLFRPIVVPVNHWIIADKSTALGLSPADFADRYTVAL